MKKFGFSLAAALATLVGLLANTPAMAQIDVGDAVSEVTSVGAAITTVGAALIGVAAIYMAYRWVKGFIKGG